MKRAKRHTQFDKWYENYFSKAPKEWRTHKQGDTYTINCVKAAFRAGKRTKA